MRLLLQRVSEARVEVDGAVAGSINAGLLVLVGVQPDDSIENAGRLVERMLGLRIFPGDGKEMNRSVVDTGGGVLLVSQFTLVADVSRGRRPGFSTAAPPDHALEVFNEFVSMTRSVHDPVATGEFGATMQVHLVNDGPTTFLLDG